MRNGRKNLNLRVVVTGLELTDLVWLDAGARGPAVLV